MTVITEIFFALAIIAIITWWYYKANKNNDFYKKIPGPPPIPIFGNAWEIKSTTDVLKVMKKFTDTYGGMVKVHMGPFRKAILVSDYKFLEYILSSTRILNKSEEYRFLQSWLGTGLLTSEGPKWKKHRRILTPAFHFQILEQFIEVFESGGNRLVQKLEKEVGKKSVDVYPFVTLCTLDIICDTAMGTSINAQDNDNSDYVRSVKNMCRIIIERSFFILQMFDLTYPLTKNYYVQKKSLSVLHQQTNSVITQRKKELKKKSSTVNEAKKKAFLDLVLEATVDGRPLTQEEIREEVDTFMFEGHDTTASAISFAVFCLANNPEVQKKAYEEQDALFGGNKNPSPSYCDLQSMKYLEQVIKETLRLYPSVPVYGRLTNQAVEYNGMTIPEGVQLNIFAFGIHRNSKYFEEPETFNPSRFDNIDGRLPYAYIPFSAGPRNCIGQKFAMLEMKSTISKIIRKFELFPASPEHKLELAAEAVLKSLNGIKVRIELRR